MEAEEYLLEFSRMCKRCNDGYDCISAPCPIAKKFKQCKLIAISNKEAQMIVNLVKEWADAHPVIKLTDLQKTAIKGRIAEGFKWIAKDKGGGTYFYEKKPHLNSLNGVYKVECGSIYEPVLNELYNFVTFESSPIYMADLLKDNGEE